MSCFYFQPCLNKLDQEMFSSIFTVPGSHIRHDWSWAHWCLNIDQSKQVKLFYYRWVKIKCGAVQTSCNYNIDILSDYKVCMANCEWTVVYFHLQQTQGNISINLRLCFSRPDECQSPVFLLPLPLIWFQPSPEVNIIQNKHTLLCSPVANFVCKPFGAEQVETVVLSE